MRTNIIIDFDNTVVDSAKRVIDLYKDKYGPLEQAYDPSVLLWDFWPYVKEQEEREYCKSLFETPDFYSGCDIIDEQHLRRFLDQYSENSCMTTRTVLCSCRRRGGFDPVLEFIEDRDLHFDRIIFTDSFDKSIVGNENDIIIDDQTRCLEGDRRMKILFGEYGYHPANLNSCLGYDYKGKGPLHHAKTWADVQFIIDMY